MFLFPLSQRRSAAPKDLLLSLVCQPHGGAETGIAHKGVEAEGAPIAVSTKVGIARLLADDVDAVFCEAPRPPRVAPPTTSLYFAVCGPGVPAPLGSTAMLQDVRNSPVHLGLADVKTNSKEFFRFLAKSITKVPSKEEGFVHWCC